VSPPDSALSRSHRSADCRGSSASAGRSHSIRCCRQRYSRLRLTCYSARVPSDPLLPLKSVFGKATAPRSSLMSALGLGCVKTPCRSTDDSRFRRSGRVWSCCRVWRPSLSGTAPDADSSRLERLCDRLWAHVCDDYARIAASSGWTPMMFMMRVRL
jgi:hypothetical protein